MRTRDLELQTDLLRREKTSFSDIEERTFAYREFYQENFPVRQKERTEGKWKKQENLSKEARRTKEKEDSNKEDSNKEDSNREDGNKEDINKEGINKDGIDKGGGHYSETRIMEGDFATLLSLYGETGEIFSVSRQGVRQVHYDLPGQGQYHRHQYIEVLYVIEGNFKQILLGEKRHFSKGEVVITDQNCDHADYLEKKDAAVLFLWLKPGFLDGILKGYEERDDLQRFLFHALDRQKREQSFLVLKAEEAEAGSEVRKILETLVAEDYGRQPGSEEIIRGNLIRLFHLLCTSYALQLHSSDQESKERVLLYEIERYIRLHAAAVTVAELEENFHYHRNYYNLLLRKYKGKSFREYVQEIRIQRAGELLLGTKLPLKQIAAQVGYENTSFFYQLFERMAGMSPGEYRKSSG